MVSSYQWLTVRSRLDIMLAKRSKTVVNQFHLVFIVVCSHLNRGSNYIYKSATNTVIDHSPGQTHSCRMHLRWRYQKISQYPNNRWRMMKE